MQGQTPPFKQGHNPPFMQWHLPPCICGHLHLLLEQGHFLSLNDTNRMRMTMIRPTKQIIPEFNPIIYNMNGN